MTWWQRIKATFAAAEDSGPAAPVDHAPLTRHRDRAEDYAQWRGGVVHERLLAWLAEQYANFLTDRGRVDEAVDFLDTPSSKGFVVHFAKTGYSLEEAEFFQLYLRERVLSRDYRTQVADARTYSRAGRTERTDRYYLKPRPNFAHPGGEDVPMDVHTAGQFDQQYGNVLIELVVRDDRPHHLRFSATVYHDRVYKDAEGFGGLMGVVLGVEESTGGGE